MVNEITQAVKTWSDQQLIDEYESKELIQPQLTTTEFKVFRAVSKEMAIRRIGYTKVSRS